VTVGPVGPDTGSDTRLRLRLLFGAEAMLGPGKADLLEAISAEGSISAAGRRMEMSYKRAWSLVDEMNAAFRDPLVLTSRGGASGGGAEVTEAGRAVLAHYRALEAVVAGAGAAEIEAIRSYLRDTSDGK